MSDANANGGVPLSAFQLPLWAAAGEASSAYVGAAYATPELPAEPLADALRQVFGETVVSGLEFTRVRGLERPVQRLTEVAGADVSVVVEADAPAGFLAAAAAPALPSDEAPLLRAIVRERGGTAVGVTISAHPLVADLATLGLSLGDAIGRLGGDAPVESLGYLDLAVTHAEMSASGEFEDEAAFWAEQAQVAPVRGSLFAGSPEAGKTGRERIEVELAPDMWAALRRLAGELHVTPEAIAYAVLRILPTRLAGERPTAIGVLSDSRATMGLDDVRGPLTQVLPDRPAIVDLEADLATAVVAADAARTALAEHEGMPPLDGGEAPEITFVPVDAVSVEGGLEVEDFALAIDPSTMNVWVKGDEDHPRLVGDLDLAAIDGAEARVVIERWARLLAASVEEPRTALGAHDLLTAAEREELLGFGGVVEVGEERAEPVAPVQAFMDAARESPEKPAVTYAEETVDYGELAAWSAAIAGRLREEGVVAGDRVGLFMEPGLEVLPAILGIHRLGAAYVPLDPDDAAMRVAQMVDDAEVRVVLTQSHVADAAPGESLIVGRGMASEADDPGCAASPDGVAYVLFTSGSTGRPKGVEITHANVWNYLDWCNRTIFADGVETVPAVTKPSFDASVKQLLGPLVRGGEVWIPPRGAITQPVRLIAEIGAREGVGLNCVVSHWANLLEAMENGEAAPPRESLRAIFIGGERGAEDLVERTRKLLPELRIWHLYGPTEATATTTAGELTSPPVTIGRPIAGARVFVLDSRDELVPAGTPGEIHIAGPGLARGYAGAPELTAERFAPLSTVGAEPVRAYRTGDRGAWTDSGELVYVGRLDTQVKVRGYRVELGEVEAAIAGLEGVRECAVEAAVDAEGTMRLSAYVAMQDGSPISGLRPALRDLLPEYMIPSGFHRLDRLPRLSTGKLDRAALRELEGDGDDRPAFVAPRTAEEELLAETWEQFLEVDQVGVNDDFFQLGGHSLLLGRVVNQLRDRGYEIPLREAFRAPTVEQMAALLSRSGAAAGSGGGDR